MKSLRTITLNNINSKSIYFDLEDILRDNCGIMRCDMPQIKNNKFLSEYNSLKKSYNIHSEIVDISILKVTQCEINTGKVLIKNFNNHEIREEDFFIVDKHYRIIDGHHRFITGLMQYSSLPVKVYKFVDYCAPELINILFDNHPNILDNPKSINEEGMGAVEFPEVENADTSGDTKKGSGDIPGTIKKKKEEDGDI